MMFILGSLISA